MKKEKKETMITEQVKKVLALEPFRPFKINLSNGASYEVAKREQVGATLNKKVVFYFGPDDDWVLIDSSHIAEIVYEKG